MTTKTECAQIVADTLRLEFHELVKILRMSRGHIDLPPIGHSETWGFQKKLAKYLTNARGRHGLAHSKMVIGLSNDMAKALANKGITKAELREHGFLGMANPEASFEHLFAADVVAATLETPTPVIA